MGANATSKITNSSAYNNTVYASLAPAVDMLPAQTSADSRCPNNIFLSISGMALLTMPEAQDYVHQEQLLQSLGFSDLVGRNVVPLAAWGQDAAGLSVNPQLVNAAPKAQSCRLEHVVGLQDC
jgi:hypothetical protein